jgi:hypothetical protein
MFKSLGEQKFTNIYKKNLFGENSSKSGRGSDSDQTLEIQVEIPRILKELHIKTIVDVPCGDWNWMRNIDLSNTSYCGLDIVTELVEENSRLYGASNIHFQVANLIKSIPPKSDLIFSRDLFVHLNTRQISECLRNIVSSESTYLLTTTFTKPRKYREVQRIPGIVGWRPINLQLPPFNFPIPIQIIDEKCTEHDGDYSDKALGLWLIKDLVNVIKT